MKIAVIYDSKTGNTKKMAEYIIEGIRSVDTMEAELFSIAQINDSYVKECAAVIVGTPTHYATLSGAVKMWLDEMPNTYDWSGKLAGAFATAAYAHGGGDIAIQSILSHFLITGAMVYSGGGAYGFPTIHLGPVAINSDLENYRKLFTLYGQRFAIQTHSTRQERRIRPVNSENS